MKFYSVTRFLITPFLVTCYCVTLFSNTRLCFTCKTARFGSRHCYHVIRLSCVSNKNVSENFLFLLKEVLLTGSFARSSNFFLALFLICSVTFGGNRKLETSETFFKGPLLPKYLNQSWKINILLWVLAVESWFGRSHWKILKKLTVQFSKKLLDY